MDSKEMTMLIEKAIGKQDISIVDSSITLFSSFCFNDENEIKDFPDDVFEAIICQMKETKLQKMSNSNIILSLFQSDWGRLNDSQKNSLFETIESTFMFFEDELSMFILSEILGEYFADNKALLVLNKLKKTGNITAKGYVTYGYGKLAKYTNQINVKRAAISELNILEKDSNDIVKLEALKALKHI